MRATRSSTGSLPKPSKLLEDIGSDYTEDLEHEEPAKKPPKRAKFKTSRGTEHKPQGLSRRKQGRLSALPTLALDILYEIFSHLEPGDLVALSRVSKPFRSVLMSRSSAFLWRSSLGCVPELPPCPDDMDEPAWANLIFGGSYCHKCGAKPVINVNFMLRIRVCNNCLIENCIKTDDPWGSQDLHDLFEVSAAISPIVEDLLSALPSTPDGPKLKGRRYYYGERYWWADDIKRLTDKCQAIASSDNTEESFAQLKSDMEESLKSRETHASDAKAWYKKVIDDKYLERQEKKSKRLNDIVERVTQLGFTRADMMRLRAHRDVNTDKPLTDKVWERVFVALKQELEAARTQRLRQERQVRQRDREWMLGQEFVKWLQTQRPLDIAYLPTFTDIRLFPDLAAIADNDVPATEALRVQMRDLLLDHNQIFITWANKRLEAVASRAPSSAALCSSFDGPSIRTAEVSVHIDPLEHNSSRPNHPEYSLSLAPELMLAATAFSCLSPRCYSYPPFPGRALFAAEILAHRCTPSAESGDIIPSFSEEASRAAVFLMDLLCLDLSTTTPEDLDRRDARFICMNCLRFSCEPGRLAMSWRKCIDHHLDATKNTHDRLAFRLLGDADTMEIRSRETPTIVHNSQRRCWGCTRCTAHLAQSPDIDYWFDREDVVSHLKDIHGVQDPQEGDYFHNPRTRRVLLSYSF